MYVGACMHPSISITYLHKFHFGVLYVILTPNKQPEAELLVGGFCVSILRAWQIWHTGST